MRTVANRIAGKTTSRYWLGSESHNIFSHKVRICSELFRKSQTLSVQADKKSDSRVIRDTALPVKYRDGHTS